MANVYVGNQWQQNALASVGSFNPAAINTGVYCTLTAGNPVVNYVGPGSQAYQSQFNFISTTFYVFGNAGVSGGTIQPQILCTDGVFRDFGLAIPIGAPGFISSVIINTPILGAQFNITNAITGGSVFLEIDTLKGAS